jgi:hypothetical protein
VDVNDSGSRPIADFVINSVEPSGSIASVR